MTSLNPNKKNYIPSNARSCRRTIVTLTLAASTQDVTGSLGLGSEGVLAGISAVYCQLRSARRGYVMMLPSLRRFIWAHSRDVQESVLILVLFVDGAHERGSRWQHFIDENEDGLLWRKLDALADHIDKLAHCKIRRHQILLLVYGRNI